MQKTVLITGASSGLGRATAALFQQVGWNVIATMRSPQDGKGLGALERVLVTRLDVEDDASITSAIDAGLGRFGQIDVLVNNAGYGAFGPLEAASIETVRRQFDVNVFGVLRTMQAVLPHFRERGAGTIINVSSTSGRITLPFGSLYHASKYAVEGATEALQYELAPLGVIVKLIEPGAIRTDFAGRSMSFSNDAELAGYQPLIEAAMGAYGKLMGGGSEPETIAQVVLTAATDGLSTLRYVAGDDASQMLRERAVTADGEFFASVRAQFGLPA
jgi:NAD(P)-dependent dehydrogenase (short-subunit alcohol dehydrogenase family)